MKLHAGLLIEVITYDVMAEMPDEASDVEVSAALEKTHAIGRSRFRHRAAILHPVGQVASLLPDKVQTTVKAADGQS